MEGQYQFFIVSFRKMIVKKKKKKKTTLLFLLNLSVTENEGGLAISS